MQTSLAVPAGEVCDFLTLSDACLPLIIQQTFVGIALGKRVGLGDKLVHGAVLLGSGNGEIHGCQQCAIALAHADDGTLLLIGDVELDTQLRIVLGIGLGNDRLDERPVQSVTFESSTISASGVFSLARSA